MLKAFENNEPYLTEEELEKEFQRGKIEAVKQFDEKPKMGGEELAERYRTTLIEVSIQLPTQMHRFLLR